MLEPSDRRLLLEALRPPSGFGLDLAVGTTFTLDLHALLTAPLAFALFDWEMDGDSPDGNVIASLEAVRRHAERIHLFCQAGEIAVPPKYRTLVGYVEDCVHEIRMPPSGIFHPKLWVLRFRRPDDEELSYRLLCLSRNLTFDRSWDTVLALEGEAVHPPVVENAPLADFLRALPDMTLWSASTEVRADLLGLANELAGIRFVPPAGFNTISFRPLGVAGYPGWPFKGNYDRVLAISPFLTAGTITRLSNTTRSGVLVSRPESIDALGKEAVSAFEHIYVLSSDSAPVAHHEEADSSSTIQPADEIGGERAEAELAGLHAKLYVAERGETGCVWTGSANATDAAHSVNVEFLVELEGPRDTCGIDSFIGSKDKEIGLIDLLVPYFPTEEPVKPSDEEEAQIALDEAARAIASLRFTAQVAATGDDRYRLSLEADEELPERISKGIRARCWPITLPREAAGQPLPDRGAIRVEFGERSFDAITSFFAFELATAAASWPRRFVVNARLVGAPDDRKERMLASLLKNAADFLAYLRFLLADLEDAQALLESLSADGSVGSWRTYASQPAVLEPMLRALARDPERLDHIARLIDDLLKTPDGLSRLPLGFQEVWQPIWQARQEIRK